MVRISKQEERRSVSRRRPRAPAVKTGPKQEKESFRAHPNALTGALANNLFIPQIK